MQGIDLILLVVLFIYIFLRAQRGQQDTGEGEGPPVGGPPEGVRRPEQVRRPPRDPRAGRADAPSRAPAPRDPIQEALERWEAQIRRRGEEGRVEEERARSEELASAWREREREGWVEAADRPAPREAPRVEEPPSPLTARTAEAPRAPVPAIEPAASRGATRRRGAGAALAALDRRPPLQRAILYAEIIGAPRGLRPHLPLLGSPDTPPA